MWVHLMSFVQLSQGYKVSCFIFQFYNIYDTSASSSYTVYPQETFEAKERKRQASNLMQMDPQGHMGMGMGMGMIGQGYI